MNSPCPQAFRVRNARIIDNMQMAAEGTVVYYALRHDYGCARDDTLYTGIKHVSVTLDPKGDYPFFTIPLEDLEPIERPL